MTIFGPPALPDTALLAVLPMRPWLPWTLAKVLAPYELTLPTDLDATLFLLPEVLDIIYALLNIILLL